MMGRDCETIVQTEINQSRMPCIYERAGIKNKIKTQGDSVNAGASTCTTLAGGSFPEGTKVVPLSPSMSVF